MTRCAFAPRARRDLSEIYDYIASDNILTAGNFIDVIERVCELLPTQPEMGRDRSQLIQGLRSIPAKPYSIFYRVSENGVEIVRILHGRRDIRRVLTEEIGD